MKLDLSLMIIGGGVLLILGLIYLLRERVMYFAINRGFSVIQRLILKVIITVGDREPEWVLLQYPTAESYTLGLLTQKGHNHSTIYLPSGPRLIPGQLVFVHNQRWQHLDVSFEEGLKMLISLGLLSETQMTAQKIWTRMEEL